MYKLTMVKGLFSEVIITTVNAVRRISSEAGRDEVTRKLGRIVTLFSWPRNRRDRGIYGSRLGV